mgnify:CR=1 FL=1
MGKGAIKIKYGKPLPEYKNKKPSEVNLIGKRFFMWTVVEDNGDIDEKRRLVCKVICDCQSSVPDELKEYRYVQKSDLMRNKTKSCGHSRRFENIVGQKFVRLTVVKLLNEKNKFGKRLCLCICDCQLKKDEKDRKYTKVVVSNLKSGNTTSCGCVQKELTSINGRIANKKYNKYDLISKEYGIGYTSSGKEFWFDKEDYDLIKDYCWYLTSGDHLRAVQLYENKQGNKKETVALHELIMQHHGMTEKDVTDHIDGNPLDNRKSNLRRATHAENAWNSKKPKTNTSGYKGVRALKNGVNKKWSAYIGKKFIGNYENKEDAAKAYEKAAKERYGEFYTDR